MEDQLTLSPVAYYEGPLTEKFGLPRQSGLVPEIEHPCLYTAVSDAGSVPRYGRLFPSVADLGFFKEPYLVPDGASAPPWRQ